MEGWIKLHRKMTDNSLYPKNRPFTQFEAWLDLLIIANHSEAEIILGNEVYQCKRGQSIRSNDTYQKRWNWSRQQVRSFLKLLEKLSMVEQKTTTKTTMLTICNYDTYQGDQPTDNQRITNQQPTDNQRITINKNEKKEKKKNNENNSLMWRENFDVFLKEMTDEYLKLKTDKFFINSQQQYYPGIDIPLSLQKCVENFWGTPAGWKNKKKSKTENPDWPATFKNALSQKQNQVFKKKSSDIIFNDNLYKTTTKW